jgi:hypothetical protein
VLPVERDAARDEESVTATGAGGTVRLVCLLVGRAVLDDERPAPGREGVGIVRHGRASDRRCLKASAFALMAVCTKDIPAHGRATAATKFSGVTNRAGAKSRGLTCSC